MHFVRCKDFKSTRDNCYRHISPFVLLRKYNLLRKRKLVRYQVNLLAQVIDGHVYHTFNQVADGKKSCIHLEGTSIFLTCPKRHCFLCSKHMSLTSMKPSNTMKYKHPLLHSSYFIMLVFS